MILSRERNASEVMHREGGDKRFEKPNFTVHRMCSVLRAIFTGRHTSPAVKLACLHQVLAHREAKQIIEVAESLISYFLIIEVIQPCSPGSQGRKVASPSQMVVDKYESRKQSSNT